VLEARLFDEDAADRQYTGDDGVDDQCE